MSTDRDIGPTEANPIRTLFLAALEKTPAERQAFMDEACAGDARLRRRIEAMLRAHDAPSHLLDQSAADHLVGEDKRELLDLLEPATKEGTLGRLGHYEIQEVVGRGGMGIVLKAFDEKLHRVVAIKLLAPALAGSTVARQRFVREARAAAAVNHDNVIGIHAVEDGGKVPYLVMQFVAHAPFRRSSSAPARCRWRKPCGSASNSPKVWPPLTGRELSTGTSNPPISCWKTASSGSGSPISAWRVRPTTPA